jgi:hypothetical protein
LQKYIATIMLGSCLLLLLLSSVSPTTELISALECATI